MTIVHSSMQQGYRGQSTTAQAQAGTNTTTDMSPARVSEAITALGSKGIGDGQTWQDMAASRAAGVTYTNTTGRSIELSIVVSSLVVGDTTALRVNGVLTSYYNITGNSGVWTHSVTVPSGSTYNLSANTIIAWRELR